MLLSLTSFWLQNRSRRSQLNYSIIAESGNWEVGGRPQYNKVKSSETSLPNNWIYFFVHLIWLPTNRLFLTLKNYTKLLCVFGAVGLFGGCWLDSIGSFIYSPIWTMTWSNFAVSSISFRQLQSNPTISLNQSSPREKTKISKFTATLMCWGILQLWRGEMGGQASKSSKKKYKNPYAHSNRNFQTQFDDYSTQSNVYSERQSQQQTNTASQASSEKKLQSQPQQQQQQVEEELASPRLSSGGGGGYGSSDDEFYDGIPRFRRSLSQKSRSRRTRV